MSTPKPYKLPERWPQSKRFEVDPEMVRKLRRLCSEGRSLDAWELISPAGPIQGWRGTEARVAGSIFAQRAGGARLSDLLDLSNARENREIPEVQYRYALTLMSRHGPLAGWAFIRQLQTEGWPSEFQARLLSLKSSVAASFRDFESANAWLAKAKSAWDNPAWHLAEISQLRFREDRFEESLEAGLQTLELRPNYGWAVDRCVQALNALCREDESVAMLEDALTKLQDRFLAYDLVCIRREQENYPELLKALDLYEKWTPLIEPDTQRWIFGTRAETLRLCGQYEEAAKWSGKADSDYYRGFTERLANPESPRKRVRLPVGFVRQHHNTCAPATLAALAGFWNIPVVHEAIAEEICYDGTYDRQQRRWAEQNGCYVREFRVTWEATKALIDQGIPFAVVTTQPTSSHIQGVIGYDELRDTLLIREPSDREYTEFIQGRFFKDYAPTGPRGMVIVPAAKQGLLESIELPDANLYDHYYRLNLALEAHDRQQAMEIQCEMEKEAPGHRLSLEARRAIAWYDQNTPAQLEAIDQLLSLFPKDQRLELSRLECLREVGNRDEITELLKRMGASREVHPIFWKEYASELANDARSHPEALRYLRRAHASAPWLSSVVTSIADIEWYRCRFEESTDLYRFAFCADDKNEDRARTYFNAARYVRHTEDALGLLRCRFEVLGAKSAGPTRTLCNCLENVDRAGEAQEVLEKALQLRPEDGELLVFAAQFFERFNQHERAAVLLQTAEKYSSRSAWLRAFAQFQENQIEREKALACWREIVELDPLAVDAHRAIVRILAETSGKRVAIEHLRKVCSRFPQNFRLQQLLLERLREESEAEAEPVIRNIVNGFPDNAWARRELAVVLSLNRKHDEALAEARIAICLAPNHSYGFSVLGSVLRKIGNFPEAREAFRQAIRLDVDNSFGIDSLIELGECVEDKRHELKFIQAELVRQVVYGDGLLAYKNVAQGLLSPEELLASLSEALDARPDLWHAWSAVTNQLMACTRLTEAEARAREMIQRFPLVPGSWRVLGGVYTLQENWNAAADAFEKAVELNRTWSAANCDWADACIKAGQKVKAKAILEKFVSRCPLDEFGHGNLADLLHATDEKEEALEHLRQAVRLSPGYDWAWEKLRAWGKDGEALQLARELTETRAGEARSWFILAESLTGKEHRAEQLEALDKAIELNPQYAQAYDTKASILADEGRYDEALAACNPPVWNGHPPTFLLGRSAWIERRRGDRKRAIELMRRAVAEDDSYRWGWQNLADWLDEEKEYKGALAAAEKLVFWSPKRAASYGYRGYAKQQFEDMLEALKDYEKAFQMDPAYTFAGWRCFDIYRNGERFKQAEATLDSLAKVVDKEWIVSAEIGLALRQRQFPRALDALTKLATMENPDADSFKNVAIDFQTANALRRLDRTLNRLVKKATLNGPAADLWAKREIANGRWFFLPAIRRLMANEVAARSAVYAWLSGVNQSCPRQLKFGLKALMTEHADWMRQDTKSWGILGQALYEARRYDDAAKWLSDWKDHQDLVPWMLTNLSFALRVLGRHAEALEISRCVVERDGTDYNTTTNRVFLAVDLALAGNAEETLRLLEPLKESDLNPREQWIMMLAKAILDLHNHGIQNGRKAIFREAKRKLRACGNTVGFGGVALAATARHALREMAKMAGCVFPWTHGLFVRRRYFPAMSSSPSTFSVGSRQFPLWAVIWVVSWILISIARMLLHY